MASRTDSTGEARFDSIDWETMDASTAPVAKRTRGFLVSIGVLGVVFCYDWFIAGSDPTLGTQGGVQWDATATDWLFILSLLALSFYVAVPLMQNRHQTRRYWRRLRSNKFAVMSLVYLIGFFTFGTIGPLIFGAPATDILARYQPPLFFTVESGSVALNCIGEVTQFGTTSQCHGSLRYPLGTTSTGESMLTLIISGMRVSLQVALISSMITVPIATAVGITAGYAGGVVDEILMRYVEIQQAVPAFLVYLILIFVFNPSLFLIVLVFGLLSWGGVARLVRSETLQRREEGYVLAAENAGVGRIQILRRHLLPNVSNTVVTATTHLVPLLILSEAALAFLNLGPVTLRSWGQVIAQGFGSEYFPQNWWVSTIPLLFLVTTVVAFSVLGDALRDVLDPRGDS